MTEYIGYAICFVFEEGGVTWSVYVNEAGVLVTQEPNAAHFEYSSWEKFEIHFPAIAADIKVIVMEKMAHTMSIIQEMQ